MLRVWLCRRIRRESFSLAGVAILATYKTLDSAKIHAIIIGWILLLSFALPYERLSHFVPELWKPIPPLQFVQLNETFLASATWGWRLFLVSALLLPLRQGILGAVLITSFFCFSLRNCFGLQIHLFASIQLTLFFLFVSCTDNLRGRTPSLVFAIKLIVVLLFFSAGLAKLRFSGITWSTSGLVNEYLRALLPLNRETLGWPAIIEFREWLLGSERIVKMGASFALLFELSIPLALFSRRASRFFMVAAGGFVLINYVCLGINFITIAPLLLVWGIWDVRLQDLWPLPKLVLGALTALLVTQLGVTLFSSSNWWPIMLNDMYAKKITLPPITELRFELGYRNGSSFLITQNKSFSPLLKPHLFINLYREPDLETRNRIVGKVLANYINHTCQVRCAEIVSLQAVRIAGEAREVMAGARITY